MKETAKSTRDCNPYSVGHLNDWKIKDCPSNTLLFSAVHECKGTDDCIKPCQCKFKWEIWSDKPNEFVVQSKDLSTKILTLPAEAIKEIDFLAETGDTPTEKEWRKMEKGEFLTTEPMIDSVLLEEPLSEPIEPLHAVAEPIALKKLLIPKKKAAKAKPQPTIAKSTPTITKITVIPQARSEIRTRKESDHPCFCSTISTSSRQYECTENQATAKNKLCSCKLANKSCTDLCSCLPSCKNKQN